MASKECASASPFYDVSIDDTDIPSKLRHRSELFRPCLASLKHRCWLCEDVAAWNDVISSFGYELCEKRTGVLCLRTIPHARGFVYEQVRKAASTLSVLLKQHTCIDEVSFYYGEYFFLSTGCLVRHGSKTFPVRLGPSVRHVKICSGSAYCYSPFQVVDLRSLVTLETLMFDGVGMPTNVVYKVASTVCRNSATLREVVIENTRMLQENSDVLWRCLRRCVRLKSALLSYCVYFSGGVDGLVRLLRSSHTLERVMIPTLTKVNDMARVAEALGNSSSLRDIYVCAATLSMASVFRALEFHSTVKCLHLADYCILRSQGIYVASMLRSNTVLRTLIIERSTISASGAEEIAKGIKENSTLQCLEFLSSSVNVAVICCLCKALDQNKTLQKLKFDDFYASSSERASLAAILASNSCYDRVLLPLVDADVENILSLYTNVQFCPTELSLKNICDIPVVLFGELCEALASSTTVHTLKVHYKGHEPSKGNLFSEMLETNRSITCLELSQNPETTSYCLVTKVAAALVHNTTLQELNVSTGFQFDHHTALSFCRMLSWNQTLIKVIIRLSRGLPMKCLSLLATGVKKNKVLLEFGMKNPEIPFSGITYPIFTTLQQNHSRLNQAVEFVQRNSTDRQCAKAFEYLCKKPHFMAHVAKVAGQSMSEAYQNITSSVRYLCDNFFVIAGIVQHSVECYPGQGTQIDALNADCWNAIAQYLKVSDINA
ncbi:uncharacterized protein LOC142582303 [Dermacentor variabilis]|uniref:uncharacterized protein LOC142582303 n=1 Tax=Dermacentor variabilis TaxID=34621 RepID=UPI003F5BC7AB